MNVERLHAILLPVRNELSNAQFAPMLQQLTSSLQNQVNQPSNGAYQQMVAQSLSNLRKFLGAAPSNSFSPAWRQILKEIGGVDLLGANLDARLQEIIERNQITPIVALQEIQKINQSLTQFKAAVEQLLSGFSGLNISSDQLQPGTSEVGIVVPRGAVSNELDSLGGELHILSVMLKDFEEIATGERTGLIVRTISSTDFAFYVTMAPIVASLFASSIQKIINIYRSLLEIRKLHGELVKQSVPEERLKGIEEHANGLMADEIEKLTVDIIKRCPKNMDSSRKNELTNSLRITLNRWANRVDRGYNVEVRIEPPEVIKKDDPVQEYVKIIAGASTSLEFVRMEGSPILSLSESPGTTKEAPKKADAKK